VDFLNLRMSFLTATYFHWHIFGNKDICAQFLKTRDLHIGNSIQTQSIKALWRRVKNKYGIKSSRATDLFEYQRQEER
jgi:hypothetical protein